MPTLTRFVILLLGLAGLVYGTAWSLATFVTPTRVERREPQPIDEWMRAARERNFIGPRRPEPAAAAPDTTAANETGAGERQTR